MEEEGEAARMACAWACNMARADEETGGLWLLLAMVVVSVVAAAENCSCVLLLVGPIAVVWDLRWAISSSEELKRRPQKSRPCIQLHM